MSTNPDARPEPILIAEHEGEKVRFHRGKLPAITLDMAEGYPRGTHLFFQVEARVGPIKYDEITAKRDERHGELIREATLYIEEVGMLGVTSAAAAIPEIGGSASNRVEERDDFEDGPDVCVYDNDDLELVHRGGCGKCRGRYNAWSDERAAAAISGPEAERSIEEEFLEAAGMQRVEPSPATDPGF